MDLRLKNKGYWRNGYNELKKFKINWKKLKN